MSAFAGLLSVMAAAAVGSLFLQPGLVCTCKAGNASLGLQLSAYPACVEALGLIPTPPKVR